MDKTKIYYYEVRIESNNNYDGTYNVEELGEKWDCLNDLISCINNNVENFIIIGKDELLPGMEDIRGRIHNEPDIVFAYTCAEEVKYGGIAIK